ncbi:family 20 glycosylhydrolase [Nonomuraea sp. NPDC050790]|uniref:family 20 glycosylhydrolase n=1 Tax=Nonomuraea sp. NPDC050790 TaxID=3364371 RepID=UPI0037AB3210
MIGRILTALALTCTALTAPAAAREHALPTAQAVGKDSSLVPAGTKAPQVIPAMREWQDGPGRYRSGPQSRVLAPTALRRTAEVFAEDLAAATGRRVPVAEPGRARPGDILLRLGGEQRGYRLHAAAVLTISGATDGDVFHGTRSALQLLRQSTVIPGGTARDWAEAGERTVMLDVGRKYYSLRWLRDHIRELAYLKYTTLQLHLSDDQGFRIESTRHPEVVSAEHYTKAEITALIDFAARRHITIIPEISMPGHMTQILAAHPGLRLPGKPGALDLSQEAAWTLARELIEEYLPLFPGQGWHLGADEWLSEREIGGFPQLEAAAKARYGPQARARDLLYGFVNTAGHLVRASGKRLRIWNDQLVDGYHVQVDPAVEISHWYGAATPTPQALRERGHRVVNANWERLYHILGISHPDPADVYERFRPTDFAGGHSAQADGVQLSVWADIPPNLEDENQVAWGLLRPLRSLAQTAWGSTPATARYDDFAPLIELIGRAPGVTTPLRVIGPVPSASLAAAPGHSLDNLLDGRPGTTFQSLRPARRGEEIRLDLGTVRQLGSLDLVLSSRIHADLETSSDGRQWSAAGPVTGPGEIHAQLPTGTSGRYVRLRLTRPAPPLRIGEFGITTVASSAGALSSSLPAHDTHGLHLAADGDPATYFWGGRGIRPGDYLTLDLGAVKAPGRIEVLMADPVAHPGDYLKQGILESSADGLTWTTLGTYRDQPEIRAGATTPARYVRLRATAAQPEWAIVREFTAS